MTTVPLADAKNRLSEYVADVERTHDRVTITRHGRTAAVLISADDLAELEETVDVLATPGALEAVAEGLADLAAGRVADNTAVLDRYIHRWSSAIRFETTEGRVWFKVNGSGTAYEASLIALLDALYPGLAPEVIAHDSTRPWLLSRDAQPGLSIGVMHASGTPSEQCLPPLTRLPYM